MKSLDIGVGAVCPISLYCNAHARARAFVGFLLLTLISREPVWPSGKALDWLADGPCSSLVRFSSVFKSSGLCTLPCDFAHHS